REVEERADSRVGLAIVIAEVAFEVALEGRDAPVGKQLPAIGEALVEFDLDRLVIADRVGEAIRHSIRAGIARRLAILTVRRIANIAERVAFVIEDLGGQIRVTLRRDLRANRIFEGDRVDRRVQCRIDVADEVRLPEEGRRFRRNDRRVFNDAPDPTVNVAHREHQVMRQLLLEAHYVLVGVTELRARQNRVGWVLRRDGERVGDPAFGPAQQVRRVNDRSHSAETIDYRAWIALRVNSEGRGKTATREILLRGKRTLRRIERQVFVEAAKVVIDLRLAFAERVNRHAKTRRPLAGEAISLSCD